jgi:hypothetical protein
MPDITFSIHKDLIEEKEIHPIPAKQNIPDWYKKIEKFNYQNPLETTIKACIPVLDSITAGYLLPLPQDMMCQVNFWNESLKKIVNFIHFGQRNEFVDKASERGYGLQNTSNEHPSAQVGGEKSFYAQKNNGGHIPKIMNPFTIKTPPGYSCLFVPPMHRENDEFQILPAIVDTDSFVDKINFPFVFNLGKKGSLNKLYKIGTPYVQVIPFKRESWKMSVKEDNIDQVKVTSLYRMRLIDIYKRKYWYKKSWK